MTCTSTVPLELGLGDVAALAKVQRPVVTMWRRRAAGTDHPFPAPVSTRDGRETFDADEIAHWLATTGRGNNPSAAADAAAFSAAGRPPAHQDPELFAALTAALCLQVVSGMRLRGMDRHDLLDRADEADPDDVLLYRELESIGDRLELAAQLADALADASMGPPEAFERLLAERRGPGTATFRAVLHQEALSLVSKVAVSLSAGQPTEAYVDPVPGAHDLLLAVARESGDRGTVEVRTPRSDVPEARLGRRRLRTHDIYREDVDVDTDGTFSMHEPVVHVAQLLGSDRHSSRADVLSVIDNVVVQMDDAQRGVVVAPATALCDGFDDPQAVAIRSGMLRAGHVRAVVRLPRGLVPARSREALALWVLGPSHHEDEAAERRTMVADLIDETLTADAVDSLVTDVAAATGSRAMVRAHAFRYLRPALTRSLLVSRRSLVETVTPRTALGRSSVDLPGRVERLARLVADVPRPVGELPRVVPSPSPAERPTTTVGDMLRSRRLRLLPGHRLDGDDTHSGTGVPVIGQPEIAGERPLGSRRIDPLLLASRYDAARLTEPGDVVFCTSPRPAALVDPEGGSVVAFPAKILRIDAANPAGLVDAVLAADINAAPPRARQWRTWPIRTVAEAQRAPLIESLRRLQRARDEARVRLRQLDELSDLITRAATSGTFALTDNTPAAPAKGH